MLGAALGPAGSESWLAGGPSQTSKFEPHLLRRVRATFAPDGYATVLEIALSADGQTWQTVSTADGLDGRPYDCQFDPVRAQFVRLRSLKPDGPEQRGAQMAVAELELYE